MKIEAPMPLEGRRLLVAASGSIAAVKTPLLVSALEGWGRGALSHHAQRLTPRQSRSTCKPESSPLSARSGSVGGIATSAFARRVG